MVGAQGTQTLRYILFREPLNFSCSRLRNQCPQSFRADKLNGSGAVLAHMGNQPEDILRRHLEAFAPILENPIVIGQQPPQERLYPSMAVSCGGERHGERERIRIGVVPPRLAVSE
jgi:hypothetical protein